MSTRNRPSTTAFRPSSLTQHREPTKKEIARQARIYPHDTLPGRSAREWFAHLRPTLLASRPVIESAYNAEYPKTRRVVTVNKKTGERTVKREPYDQIVYHPPVYGKPTFKNIILDGVHQ